MRRGTGAQRVTNIELFFDLVFVFAITQLSFLAGHGLFKAAVWRVVPWTRIAAIAALIALLPAGSALPALALAALAIVLGVVVGDRRSRRAG